MHTRTRFMSLVGPRSQIGPAFRDESCEQASEGASRTRPYRRVRSLRRASSMSVREFRDDAGRRWRAWDIKPEEVRPVTRAEDYLADCYVTGWIVFETLSGSEKR